MIKVCGARAFGAIGAGACQRGRALLALNTEEEEKLKKGFKKIKDVFYKKIVKMVKTILFHILAGGSGLFPTQTSRLTKLLAEREPSFTR